MQIWGFAQGQVRALEVEKGGEGLRIEGVPRARTRAIRDRVLAALRASGFEDPEALITVDPPIRAGCAAELDLALVAACLAASSDLPDVPGGGLMAWGTLGPRGEVRAIEEPPLALLAWPCPVLLPLGQSVAAKRTLALGQLSRIGPTLRSATALDLASLE